MYILAKPDTQPVYPYSFGQLRKDNPNTSFTTGMTDEQYAKRHMYRIQSTTRPQFDPLTQRLVEGDPTLVGDVWQQTWTVVQLTQEEISQIELNTRQQLNDESREYLASTDWYVVRKSETGVEIPTEVLQRRAAARSSIV